MSGPPHTVGRRPPHERAHVFAAAHETWRPAGISGRDAIPLNTFHRIVRHCSVPEWTEGDHRWKAAFFDFKRELTALFPDTPEGSHEWNKLLFRYDRPAREDQHWPDLRDFDEGRWAGHKRTGQLWFLVQLTEDLWRIADNEEEDLTAPKHLVRLRRQSDLRKRPN